MIFKEYKTEEEFLLENEEILLAEEDINNIILGILPQVDKEKILFRIENDSKIELIGVITKTERKGLLVYIENNIISIDVCEFLVDQIVLRNIDLKEIRAPKGIAETIFDLYVKKKEVNVKTSRKNYLMRLNKLNEKYNKEGIIRKATIDDLEYEKEIVLDIHAETLGEDCSEEDAYKIAKIYIEKGLYFLIDENGEILSQAVTSRTLKNGYAIGAIYTPINKRRKGYARLCIYKVVEKILSENKDVIVLYSNTNNLKNRNLYESLGFQIILEESVIKF